MYKPVKMTDLVLLVGTNPLPNYVSAKFFLDNETKLKRIWLVHSEKNKNQEATEEFAVRLQNLLLKQLPPSKQIDFIKNNLAIHDVGNAKSIGDTIEKFILGKIEHNDHIHLNYTGGTKAMGTHSYRAIENFCKAKDRDCSFSYLDARSFRIVFDYNENCSDDLRTLIFPEFEDLITLHGFHRINKDSESKFGALLNRFREMINNQKIQEFYFSNNYKQGFDRELFLDRNGKLAKKIDLSILNLENCSPKEKVSAENLMKLMKFEINDTVQSLFDIFDQEKKIFVNGKFNNDLSQNSIDIKAELEYIDGIWLEDYIYELLKDKLTEHDIKTLTNWEIKSEIKSKSKKFQLDVLLLKGYQITGISCTTSSVVPICKSKGFEIIQRIRQIGGSESKAILVTFLKETDVTELEEGLLLDTGSSKNIKVFGLPDILSGELCQKIINFLEMEEN